MDILHEAVIERLSCPRPHNSDFDLGLSCLPILTRGETINALETHRQTLSHKITQIKLKMEKDIQNPSTPPHVKILFDHNLALMRSEMDWVELIILEMKGK
jgi:hypothetical protein